MTHTTAQTRDDYAQTIIDAFAALAELNAEQARKAARAKRMGLGWLKPEYISDHLLKDLLAAMIDFDCDPAGTLEELTRTDEPWGNGRVIESDVAFDWRTSRGVVA